jgi:hypothetical protein
MKNEEDKRKNFKYQRAPSLRDLMLGKGGSDKKLEDNFFEKVLDLELKIKREFNVIFLQELVASYSVKYIHNYLYILLTQIESNRIL